MGNEVTDSSWGSRFRQIPGATLALVITGALGRVITLLTQTIIAREFGLSVSSDAYFAVEKVPELFLSFVATGFSAAFIPMFAHYRADEGDEEAWRFASSFLFLSVSASILLAVVIGLGAPVLVSIIAPGFHGVTRELALTLLRLMAPAIIFLGLSASLLGMLQSHKAFILPEIGRITYNVALLSAAWFLSRELGIFALALGIVLGAMAWAVIQFTGALRRGMLKLVWVFNHPGARCAAKQLGPFIIAISGVEIAMMLNRIVASGLSEGSVAALNYAGRIILLPVGLFAIPFRTVLYPSLSNLAARRECKELAKATLSGLRILLFVIIPACVGLIALRFPLTRLLFERGAFDHYATQATSEALLCYAAGVPAIAMIFFLNNIYFSLGDSFTLVKLNILSWVTNLSLSLLLSRYLDFRGVAIATSTSMTLTVILMIYFLKREHLESLALKSLTGSIGKTIFVSALMGSLLFFLSGRLENLLTNLQLNYQCLQVIILILIGAATYLLTAGLLKVDELMTLTANLRVALRIRES